MESRSIELLGVFVETLQAGSFSVVARQRGKAASSISRQIDTLEKELGVPLLIRSTRSIKPTAAGELFFRRALGILDAFADAKSEVTSYENEVQGILQVSCFPTFGRRYVVPCLNRLFEKYPDLHVDLDLTENLVAPTVERQDIAIRFGAQPDSSLVATKLGTQRFVMCASPRYFSRFGLPDSIEALMEHRLIDKRHRSSRLGWREVIESTLAGQARYIMEADDYDVQRLMALGGSGIARLPDWVVGADIQAGLLEELALPDMPSQGTTGIYLLRALFKPSAKIKVFIEEMLSEVESPNVWSC